MLPYTSVAECRVATSIISMGYAYAPQYVWGNRNRISPKCCPTIVKTLEINMGQKVLLVSAKSLADGQTICFCHFLLDQKVTKESRAR